MDAALWPYMHRRKGTAMGLFRVKDHETFDQYAFQLATLTRDLVASGVDTGNGTHDAAVKAIAEVSERIKEALKRGMSRSGYARTMKSYENALVMLGWPREAASRLKTDVRRRVALP